MTYLLVSGLSWALPKFHGIESFCWTRCESPVGSLGKFYSLHLLELTLESLTESVISEVTMEVIVFGSLLT